MTKIIFSLHFPPHFDFELELHMRGGAHDSCEILIIDFGFEKIEQCHVLLCFDNLSIDSKCMFAFDSLRVHSAGNLLVLIFQQD
jgi:hypothetical protein